MPTWRLNTTTLFLALAIIFIASSEAAAVVEGNCTRSDAGLQWLQNKLSSTALISCKGSPGQELNARRYWGIQYSKVANVVVFPANADDVSFAVRATSKTPLGKNYAFVSGGHSMTNASSSYGLVIDLLYLNHTQILPQYPNPNGRGTIPVISYEGGSTWAQVEAVTAGSGWTAVGARISNVGVGGFSTGGGIGFLAGAYGYAVDRLVALDVVLPCGDIVKATKYNKYSDIFWAFQGAGGQFGIITKFYQEAAIEPTESTFGAYYIDDTEVTLAQSNTVDFFNTNTDPFSIVYFATGFVPPQNSITEDPSTFAVRTLLVTLRLGNPTNSSQAPYNVTFSSLLNGLTPVSSEVLTVPYTATSQLTDPSFPYGFRRGFYGPQTTKITVQYLRDLSASIKTYVSTLLSRGDFPASTLFVLQYMSPGLNSHLPASDRDTSWPHSVAGHQTLFSPAWLHSANDAFVDQVNAELTNITYTQQKIASEDIKDYPNYISPGESGRRVWGENLERIFAIKEKYDPECTINRGRVFASKGCKRKGLANVFA